MLRQNLLLNILIKLLARGVYAKLADFKAVRKIAGNMPEHLKNHLWLPGFEKKDKAHVKYVVAGLA